MSSNEADMRPKTAISKTTIPPSEEWREGEEAEVGGGIDAEKHVIEEEMAEEGNNAEASETKSEATSQETHSAVEAPKVTQQYSNAEDINEAPPLPDEEVPPLPQEPLPAEDDGWAPVWEDTAQAFYFYNRFTGATQWTNPRVPEASQFVETAPGVSPKIAPSTATREEPPSRPLPAGGYDPSIHGDYDPTAWYAQPPPSAANSESTAISSATGDDYAATGAFNRFTGRWQAAELGPELHNDENKSKRQMNAFFDVDAAANSHDGRSLKAERSGKKLSKTELKQFKEKRKARKEEKRRAWLRD